MEIWGKAPLESEPVAHINFFVPSSMRCALEESGLRMRYGSLTTCLHPSGRLLPAVRAVGTGAAPPPIPVSSGWKEVDCFLKPGFRTRLWSRWRLRAQWRRKVKAEFRRLIPKRFRP